MIEGIDVVISIRDMDKGTYMVIPVSPAEIQYQDGSAMATTVNILNLGDIDIPSGVSLDSLTWSAFFPANYDPAYCTTDSLLEPNVYRNRLSAWKDAGTPLQVIIPSASLNKMVYLVDFSWSFGRGFEGDMSYTVTFKELKTLKPKKLTPEGETPPPKGKKTPADRPAAPSKDKPKTYTVKSGDSLSLIGKRLGISWNTIYTKNKALIGPDPNKIKVGQVLKL